MPRRSRSLLWQLAAALMTMQLLVAAGLAWYVITSVRAFHVSEGSRWLEQVVPLLAGRYLEEWPASADDEPAFDLMVKEDGRRGGMRVTVIRPDGRVIADSHFSPGDMDNHRFRPEVQAALDGRSPRFVHHRSKLEGSLLFYAAAYPAHHSPRAVIRAGFDLDAFNAELTALLRAIGLAVAASLLLTLGVTFAVSRGMSRTVARLAAAATRFAGGHFGHRIDRPRARELAALADALNHMATQVADQVARLQEQRNEQQAILQSMSSGVIALDTEQRILSLNHAAERLLGLTGDAAQGRLLQEVIRQPMLNRFVAAALASPSGTSDELRLEGAINATLQAASEPLRNAAGRPVGALILLNDVTMLRRLESLRSDFAANVSHELRTPITSIKGYVETMLDVGVDDADRTRRFLEVIKSSTDRLAAIIEDLMALTRLEQPDFASTLEAVRTPLRRVVAGVFEQLRPRADEKRISLEIAPVSPVSPVLALPTGAGGAGGAGDGGLEVNVYPQLVEQALMNLVDNAIKYSPPETTVTISMKPTPNGMVELAVADQGPGIAAEHLPRIFERFYRVDRARSRSLGGTGLGLSIVKHIALIHGGRVEVESTVGRGSTFRLLLPRA